jgi:hypothetical protein
MGSRYIFLFLALVDPVSVRSHQHKVDPKDNVIHNRKSIHKLGLELLVVLISEFICRRLHSTSVHF